VAHEAAQDAGGYAKQLSDDVMQRERALVHEHAAAADVVITTALIPGKPAPRLISAETVQAMKPGSVIIDLAGEAGGNCELSVAGEKVVRNGVTIIAPPNLPSELPYHASPLHARHVRALLELLAPKGEAARNFHDEIERATVW